MNMGYNARFAIATKSSSQVILRLLCGTTGICIVATGVLGARPASAQAPVPNLVSACSGVSLPRSVVTGIISPVVSGIVTPVQDTVNPLLGILVPPLNIDAATLLANAAAGQPITLQALNRNGTAVGPADRCDVQGDSFQLNTEGGIAIGGNRITGLGSNGLDAVAGEAGSIAFGNSANTSASATNAIAIGTGASVTAANSVALGAGSAATRGALTGYTALGVTGPQTSAGEFSVGAAGVTRQITNVAAGTEATDAVNLQQLSGVAAQVGTLAGNAVQYDSATHDRITLTGAAGTTIGNVAPGALAAGSTEAVNGGQLFATNTNIAGNTTNIANLTNNVQNGAVGTVRYSDAAAPTVPNGGTPTNDLTLVGAAATPVGLHNVRDGVVAAGSTDAVNGGQLAGLGAATSTVIGGTTVYDPGTNSFVTNLAYGGAQYTTVQGAITAIDNTINGGAGIRYFHVASSRPDSVAGGADSVAIGPEANASAANSVAIGAGAVAARGATAAYTATGLTGPQTSAGEFSVGAAGAERQITNVAAGTALTDAATVGQVQGVAASVAALGDSAVQYDGADRTTVTLAGAGGTTVTNVRAGALNDTSTDAVNGAQLYATNQAVAANTTAITNLGDTVTNLGNTVANGGVGPVQYSDPGTPTTPNGGVRTNDLTLVGGTTGAVALHNVGGGTIAPGSTDAVNGGQVYALGQNAVNAVTYDTDTAGNRTGAITLAGATPGATAAINNVAAAPLNATSTGAVNGAQLYATNQNVATAQTTANTAVALGQNSVQYDAGHTSVTFNSGSTAATLHNVGPGTSGTDAVNVSQLNSSINGAITQANNYTDSRINSLNFDLRNARRDNDAGIAGALASAGLPQAYTAGKGMIAFAGGAYGSEQAFAVGFSKAFNDASTVVKLSGNYDSRGRVGGAAGIGYQF